MAFDHEISDLDNIQLSTIIAQHLEPRSTLTSIGSADFDRGVIDEKVISALGCWYFIRDEDPVWLARDFVQVASCTLMLMKKMILHTDMEAMAKRVSETPAAYNSGTVDVLGRAVAEAFVQMFGLV